MGQCQGPVYVVGAAGSFPPRGFLRVWRCGRSLAHEATQHLEFVLPKFPSGLSGIQGKTGHFRRLSSALLLHQPLLAS